MKPNHSQRAFTVIELLVVVSIIALLVGILLPAIGKAREQAQLTRSQANVKQLGTAAATYSAEWNDRQVTWCNDYLSKYGTGAACVTGYQTAHGGIHHPSMILGYAQDGTWWGYWLSLTPANYALLIPIEFTTKFGSFRYPNGRQFSQYLNGRFYDPVYYAPKDTVVLGMMEGLMDSANEFDVNPAPFDDLYHSSYCFSPAGMVNPDVLSLNRTTNLYWSNPWQLPAGWRSPSMSQAQFGDLKTHILEHHWLQGRKKMCNPGITGSVYNGCEPYYFNHGYWSTPVTLFYDGHIEGVGATDARDANARIMAQGGGPLWSKDTPMGGAYAPGSDGGYFMEVAFDSTATSFHILTRDGIKGRDLIAE